MIHFGKIDYLNLLPFEVFLKQSSLPTQIKQTISWRKDIPSAINKRFIQRKIDAAFISSYHSPRYKKTSLGIVAKGKVQSVILIPNEEGFDKASASSNALKNLLGLEGRVLIGDAALRYVLEGHPHIDMSEEWHKKTKLPFVFATLTYHANGTFYRRLSRQFLQKKRRIPTIILKWESQKRSIAIKDIHTYLEHISYNLTPQALRGLTLFLRQR
jgi:chorismate dehydratase